MMTEVGLLLDDGETVVIPVNAADTEQAAIEEAVERGMKPVCVEFVSRWLGS